MATAGGPERSQSHAGFLEGSATQPDRSFVGVVRLSLNVPVGGELVGVAILRASAAEMLLLLLLLLSACLKNGQ